MGLKKGLLEALEDRERQAVEEYLQRLLSEYGSHIREVILFGSKARGEGDSESDIDIMVLVDSDDWRLHKEMGNIGAEIDLKYDVVLMDFFIGPKRFQVMQELKEPLYQEVKRDGIELWKSTLKS